MTEAEYSEIVEEIRNDYSKLSEAALIDYSRRWDECSAILHEMKHVLKRLIKVRWLMAEEESFWPVVSYLAAFFLFWMNTYFPGAWILGLGLMGYGWHEFEHRNICGKNESKYVEEIERLRSHWKSAGADEELFESFQGICGEEIYFMEGRLKKTNDNEKMADQPPKEICVHIHLYGSATRKQLVCLLERRVLWRYSHF